MRSNQNALNTTAHNLSNVDTPAYVRQQVLLGTQSYVTISRNASATSYQQYGLGVNYSQVRQVRDYFLDKTFRRESGRSMFYQASAEALESVEDLLQELQGESFAQSMQNLWGSVQDMARDPSSSVRQGVFIQRCSEFIQRASSVYDGLVKYQDNLNEKIKGKVELINAYGEKLSELNQRIMSIEAGGIEHANDLRDQREQILDELAQMANISYEEDITGQVSVQIEGTDFLNDGNLNKISLYTDDVTGFCTPYWSQFAHETVAPDGTRTVNIEGAEVFDLTKEVSPDLDTDIGGLRAMLLARGDHHATYKDMEDKDYYNKNISQSILMNIQAEFDQLINKVATTINQVLKDAADKAAAENPDSTYLKNPDGSYLQVFELISDDPGLGFTSTNIVVNEELKHEPTKLVFMLADGKADYETTGNLKDAFMEEKYGLNPNVENKNNFIGYYNSLVQQVGDTGKIQRAIASNQEKTVNSAAAAREQVIGVSSDEELGNMIMFQNAYNAASRYINVISEMLEHVVTTLGR